LLLIWRHLLNKIQKKLSIPFG